MDSDKVSIGTQFMKQIIGRIVKSVLKKNGIDLKHFTLKELDVTHEKDNVVGLNVSLNAQIDEGQFLAMLSKFNIL